MTESTPTEDCKTSIQPYLRQAERGHQKGSPKFRGGRSRVLRRLSLHGPAPPRAPQEMWTPRLSIINRETPVHMSTSARCLLKSSKLSPKMAVDSPRGGVHTPFGPGRPATKAYGTLCKPTNCLSRMTKSKSSAPIMSREIKLPFQLLTVAAGVIQTT